MSEVFLRLPEVMKKTGLSRSTIYCYIRENRFPASIKLGPRMVAWLDSEVQAWMEDKVQANRHV